MKTGIDILFHVENLSHENRQKKYRELLDKIDTLNAEELYEVFVVACKIEELQKTILTNINSFGVQKILDTK